MLPAEVSPAEVSHAEVSGEDLSGEVIEQTLSTFIVENFLFGDAAGAPARDLPLVQSGLVDSTGILEIVAFLESEFGVQTADDELAVDNFGSIATIARFVVAKRR